MFPHGTPWVIAWALALLVATVCLSQRCSRMAHFQRGLGLQGSGEEKKDGEEQEKAPVARATEE